MKKVKKRLSSFITALSMIAASLLPTVAAFSDENITVPADSMEDTTFEDVETEITSAFFEDTYIGEDDTLSGSGILTAVENGITLYMQIDGDELKFSDIASDATPMTITPAAGGKVQLSCGFLLCRAGRT